MPPLGKAPGVTDEVAELAQHQPDFAHVTLVAALAEVCGQGLADIGLPTANSLPQPLEHGNPELHREGCPA